MVIKVQETSCSSLSIRTFGYIPSFSIIFPQVEERSELRGGWHYHQELVFHHYITAQLSSLQGNAAALHTSHLSEQFSSGINQGKPSIN